MGLLKVFQKLGLVTVEHVPVKELISLQDLPAWFTALGEEISAKHKLDAVAADYFQKLKETRSLLEAKTEKYQQNLPSPSLQPIFMSIRNILHGFVLPEKATLTSMVRLHAKLGHVFEALQQKGEEAWAGGMEKNPLLEELERFSVAREDFSQKMTASGFSLIEELAEKTIRLEALTKRMAILETEIQGKTERLTLADAKRLEKEHEFKSLQEHPSYRGLREALERKQEFTKKLEENDDAIFAFFSVLKPALVKYLQVDAANQLAYQYADFEQVSTVFVADAELRILHVLRGLKQALSAGTITLPTEQSNAVHGIIDKGLAGYAQRLQQQHQDIIMEIQKLETQAQNRSFLLRVDDAKYRMDHFNQQTFKLKTEINLLQEETSNKLLQREREVASIRENLKNTFGRDVEIHL